MTSRPRSSRTPFIAAILVLAVSLLVALAFERVYDIRIRPRPTDPLLLAAAPGAASAQPPLPLRLVDIGGVGIPLEGWGQDYSHDRRLFRDVILENAPYVDAAALQRVEREWHSYVDRMVEYGNNAISVPMLLELIDFNRVIRQGELSG